MTDEYVELVCDDVSHDAVLTDPGVRVLDVAQVVRRLKGLSLWHSKVLVTEVPAVILAGVPRGSRCHNRLGPPRGGSTGGDARTAGAGVSDGLSTARSTH